MKKNYIIYLTASLSIFMHQLAYGQASSGYYPAPNPNEPSSISPPDFLGWDASTTIPLQIRHDADNVVEFWTNGEYKARIGNSTEFSLIVGNGSSNY